MIFSQTAVKDFEKETTCPFRWKSQWVDRAFRLPSSEDMERGKYFEQLFLGASAIGDEGPAEVGKLANGKKPIDILRIEAQAERAKRLFDPADPDYLGLTIVGTQIKLSDGTREGTIDIECRDADNVPWVLDVKLTKDLTSDRTQYGWGNDWSELDLLQQLHYEALYEFNTGIRPKMGLLVFDYSPQKRIEFGEIIITDAKRKQKELRFNSAIEAYNLYEENGWIKLPSLKECDSCPLTCDKRMHQSPIVKKKINY